MRKTNLADSYEVVAIDELRKLRAMAIAGSNQQTNTTKPANENEGFPSLRAAFWLCFAYCAALAFVWLWRWGGGNK